MESTTSYNFVQLCRLGRHLHRFVRVLTPSCSSTALRIEMDVHLTAAAAAERADKARKNARAWVRTAMSGRLVHTHPHTHTYFHKTSPRSPAPLPNATTPPRTQLQDFYTKYGHKFIGGKDVTTIHGPGKHEWGTLFMIHPDFPPREGASGLSADDIKEQNLMITARHVEILNYCFRSKHPFSMTPAKDS